MSLEAKIETLTAAVETLTAAVQASTEGRAEAVAAAAALKGGDAEAPKRGRPAKAAEPKPADTPKLTIDAVRAQFAGYLAVDDKDEKAARAKIVTDILGKLGAPKVSEIPDEKLRVALDYLNDAINNDPAPPASEDVDDLI